MENLRTYAQINVHMIFARDVKQVGYLLFVPKIQVTWDLIFNYDLTLQSLPRVASSDWIQHIFVLSTPHILTAEPLNLTVAHRPNPAHLQFL